MPGIRRIGPIDDLRELPTMFRRDVRSRESGAVRFDSRAWKSEETRPGIDDWGDRMIEHVRLTWSTTSGESGSVRLPRFEASEYIRALIERHGRRTLRIKSEPA